MELTATAIYEYNQIQYDIDSFKGEMLIEIKDYEFVLHIQRDSNVLLHTMEADSSFQSKKKSPYHIFLLM